MIKLLKCVKIENIVVKMSQDNISVVQVRLISTFFVIITHC